MQQERTGNFPTLWKRMNQRCGRVSAGGLLLLAFAFTSAFAQENPSGNTHEKSQSPAAKPLAASAANPAKEADIRRLLELTGAKKNAQDFGQQIGEYLNSMLQKSLPQGGEHNKQIGDTLVNTLTARLGSDEMIARLVPVYDKTFSADEVKGIVRFYESAVGQRLLAATPDLMEEANNVSEAWVQELIPQIMRQMSDQFPELQQPDK
jgi:hypothetical protein